MVGEGGGLEDNVSSAKDPGLHGKGDRETVKGCEQRCFS